MPRSRDVFDTVKSEGALLPPDLLERLAQGDKDLDGLNPESFHLDKADRINEAANSAWTQCRDAWLKFVKQRDAVRDTPTDTGVTITRERWLLKLFEALGFGRLQAHRSIEIDEKVYPVSHLWNHTPFLLTSFKYKIDTAEKGVFRSSPHSLMQELLNRSDDHLWAIVSNGHQLRILRDNVSFTRAAYVEFDLEAMMDGEVYSDFVLLWLLCHQSRVESDKPEQCWLEKWHQAARQQGTRALDSLRVGVEKAIEALGQGFLAHKDNRALRSKLADGDLDRQAYYQQLLRIVYRFIFLLVAEDRDLLLDPQADESARRRYRDHYALGRLRRLAEKRRGTRHSDLWQGIQLVLGKLYQGEPRLGLPALGSWLFSADASKDLNDCVLRNDHLLTAIRSLAFTQDGKVLRPVDYKNLGAEELGSVYESLLELHPDINAEAATFELSAVSGSERKTTGSYYTPSSLINCLLDSALDPVVEDRLKGKSRAEAEQALLGLKICDPACGSGHFLIAAANRVAKHLAAVRTGDEEPSPADQRAAFRDVVGHCIYGVDLNPMAVELCKVALWLESIDPGRPLSFLDHRIQCGNSLIGATPRLLKEGIPDDAFKPIEGDDKALCREYKRRNKEEREGQHFFTFEGAIPSFKLGNLAESLMQLEAVSDDSLEGVETKADRYEQIVHSSGYENAHLLADAWCAAFVWPKTKDFEDAITESVFRRIEANPRDIVPWIRQEIGQLRDQYQFFHWHLAFPDVFRVPTDDESSESEQATCVGGYDVVLGNPPWERIKIQEKEWFAERASHVALATNASARRKAIKALQTEDPGLWELWCSALRRAAGELAFVRQTRRFPLCGRGDVNTYSVFAELNRSMLSPGGRTGFIVPSGLALDATTQFFFHDLIKTETLTSFLEFENVGFFGAGHGHMVRFALTTICGSPRKSTQPVFMFRGQSLSDLAEPSRQFSLSVDDIWRINPNTGTCPIFGSKCDAELTKYVYTLNPVLIKDARGDSEKENAWNMSFLRMFDLSLDSELLRTRSSLDADGWREDGRKLVKNERTRIPLYESKMTYTFNHRHGDFGDVAEGDRAHRLPAVPIERLSAATYYVAPRYWVEESEVRARIGDVWTRNWMIGWRDITDARASIRSVISTVIPVSGCSDTYLLAFPSERWLHQSTVLPACLSSFALDYVARQKIGGLHLKYHTFKQLPILSPDRYEGPAPWDTHQQLLTWLVTRTLDLTYTAWDLVSFAADCAYSGPPFRWDERRRFFLRCELDAAYFHLYLGSAESWTDQGSQIALVLPTRRDAVDYIMDTFPIVKRKDEKAHGEYRTKRVIREIFDEMARAIETGEPYQTRLDPPPGPPADEQGNFLPLPEWKPGQPRPADWPPHIHAPREVFDWCKEQGIDWRTLYKPITQTGAKS